MMTMGRRERSEYVDDVAEEVDENGQIVETSSEEEEEAPTAADAAFVVSGPDSEASDEVVHVPRREKGPVLATERRMLEENAGLRGKRVDRAAEARFRRARYYDTDEEEDATSGDDDGFVVVDGDDGDEAQEKQRRMSEKTSRRARVRRASTSSPSSADHDDVFFSMGREVPQPPFERLPTTIWQPPAAAVDLTTTTTLMTMDPKAVVVPARKVVASEASLSTPLQAPKKKKAPAPPYKVGHIKPLVKDRKIAPLFLSKGTTVVRPARASQAGKKRLELPPEARVGVFLDKQSKLFYRDADGRTSPRDW